MEWIGRENRKWPTSGLTGYVTPAVWAVPNHSERGRKSEVAPKWAYWVHNPCRLGVPSNWERGRKTEVAPKWADGSHNSRL